MPVIETDMYMVSDKFLSDIVAMSYFTRPNTDKASLKSNARRLRSLIDQTSDFATKLLGVDKVFFFSGRTKQIVNAADSSEIDWNY